MACSEAFERVAARLESESGLDRLAARGTLRIALREAALDAATVDAAQLRGVVAKVLPGELGRRGLADPTALCAALEQELGAATGPAAGADSPEAIFERLIRG